MKKITSLDQLDIPNNYKGFLAHFLCNASKVDYVSRVLDSPFLSSFLAFSNGLGAS